MKIEVIEITKNSLRFKLLGARHTIPEILKNQLLEDKDVIMASYTLKHPEDPDSIFFIKVKAGKTVKHTITMAVKNLKKEFSAFEKDALKVLPKEKKTAGKK